MRQQTLNQLSATVSAVRDHFQKDVIRTFEYVAFTESRPDIIAPAAFMQICRGDARGTVDLSKYEQFIANLSKNGQEIIAPQTAVVEVEQETDEQINERINLRFDVMDMMAKAVISGTCRSMIVSGPAGCGKSTTIMQNVKMMDKDSLSILKGKVTSIGLFKTLWKHRFHNHVIILDDSDAIFENETSLNFLKAACDSSEERFITLSSNAQQLDEDGEEIPTTFEFNGSVIFISNIDFHEEIAKNGKLSCHLSALMSRSHVITLNIKTEREYMIRIKSVVANSNMLSSFEKRIQDEVVQFIDMNRKNMAELSLRMVKKVADLTRIDPTDWRKIASVSCFK